MLAPHDRRVILDALRPPEGYRIDRAIATTYTLDLVALLLAPLSFSMFDALAEREKCLDSLGLIRAVREHAARLSVFCQAEGIACPGRYPMLVQYLESAVVPVKSPDKNGVFHVKLWVLRFESGEGESVRYRVLVPSRNLTFDRSWDALLALDGVLTDRSRAYARNHPLADLVAALPGLAVKPPSERITRDCAQIADELRRVDFELPEPFEEMAFYPLGIGAKSKDPFDERIDRMLVISPFVTAGRLAELAGGTQESVLVSRVEELARLSPSALEPYAGRVYVLDEATTPDEDEDARDDPGPELPERPPPHGLHAKIYIADAGWKAHVWTGSANATSAAFERNVELLVKLSGKKSQLGIDHVLSGGGEGSLSSLLRSYTPSDAAIAEPEARDPELDAAARSLATTPWRASINASDGPSETYSVTLEPEHPPSVSGVRVAVWPITLPEGRARAWTNEPLRFVDCSLEALTPFFAFRVSIGDDAERTTTFVVRAELEGVPEHRPQRLLQTLLQDPQRLMRFLELLLSSDPLHALGTELELLEGEGAGKTGGAFASGEPPLFEMLVRALATNPQQLEHVKSLVDELGGTTTDHPLFNEEFHRIWRPIWQAYEQREGGR